MCVKLEKEKKCYFSNLNTKCVVDHGEFWKTVKSSFSYKSNNLKSIALVENNRIVSDDTKVAKTVNYDFSSLVENLKLKVPENLVNPSCQNEDPIFQCHCQIPYESFLI